MDRRDATPTTGDGSIAVSGPSASHPDSSGSIGVVSAAGGTTGALCAISPSVEALFASRMSSARMRSSSGAFGFSTRSRANAFALRRSPAACHASPASKSSSKNAFIVADNAETRSAMTCGRSRPSSNDAFARRYIVPGKRPRVRSTASMRSITPSADPCASCASSSHSSRSPSGPRSGIPRAMSERAKSSSRARASGASTVEARAVIAANRSVLDGPLVRSWASATGPSPSARSAPGISMTWSSATRRYVRSPGRRSCVYPDVESASGCVSATAANKKSASSATPARGIFKSRASASRSSQRPTYRRNPASYVRGSNSSYADR